MGTWRSAAGAAMNPRKLAKRAEEIAYRAAAEARLFYSIEKMGGTGSIVESYMPLATAYCESEYLLDRALDLLVKQWKTVAQADQLTTLKAQIQALQASIPSPALRTEPLLVEDVTLELRRNSGLEAPRINGFPGTGPPPGHEG